MATNFVAFSLGLAASAALAVGLVFAAYRWWSAATRRAESSIHKRFGARIDSFKFAAKRQVVADLLRDPKIAAAIRAHSAEHGLPEDEGWKRVRAYLDEMVPQFRLIMYYQVGLAIAEPLLKLFFRVSVVDRREGALAALPKDSIVVYVINHRSHADFMLVGYALAGQVALSYAVGEWARVFPLDYLFKAFGAYFIRRRFREPLYHTVLERYVQLITSNGVTQGFFPEGGLSRDGKFRPAKIGLLDYIIGVARDPAVAARTYLVPVAINYDRVLDDRSLLRELHPDAGHRPPSPLTQFGVVIWTVAWNIFRIVTRSWKRHGNAAVVIGEPVSLAPWLAEVEAGRGQTLFSLTREERLGEVQKLADDAMRWIGELMPIPAVPLVCAAIQSLEADYISRARLRDRVAEILNVLEGDGRILVPDDESVDNRIDRAVELLRSRLGIARSKDGIVVLPSGRELVSFYANSIVHLLGDFAVAVKARDSLPVHTVLDF